MKQSAHDFMSQQKQAGKHSRLEPLKNDILLLHFNGYTLAQIIEFLSNNDVRISKTALHYFIKTRAKEKNDKEQNQAAAISSQKKRADDHHSFSEMKSDTADKSDLSNKKTGGPRRFEWGAPPSDEELFGETEIPPQQ